jgi:hypothetical protein
MPILLIDSVPGSYILLPIISHTVVVQCVLYKPPLTASIRSLSHHIPHISMSPPSIDREEKELIDCMLRQRILPCLEETVTYGGNKNSLQELEKNATATCNQNVSYYFISLCPCLWCPNPPPPPKVLSSSASGPPPSASQYNLPLGPLPIDMLCNSTYPEYSNASNHARVLR